MIKATADPPKPWIYLIVATGDIYEDIPQAQAAAREGADIVAVIRSTGQSLLDYVPEGATREGFAGTYATRENFRLMRAALDDVSRELGRYVRLTNYASGLCMPEIAALAGLERLDMMLNDCMYGIIFRDINPRRTFIDQRFSRQIHARAGIIINTGEDNYLTTADAVDAAHTVVVSQLLNEFFGKEAGLADGQLGLGHAFEINPEVPDSFVLELAHAQLVRELFPDAPLKYMPPTKHMTGNVFAGYLLDAFFNLAGVMTDQSILLIGMMTEGIHTPFLSDRDLALENVRYVARAAARLGENFRPPPGGFVERRAQQVLGEAVDLLRRISRDGLLNAIADGTFGVTRRPADGGRGLDGVIERADGYFNPASEFLEAGPAAARTGGSIMSGQVIRPYGDTTGDGQVQVSFTLPVPFGTEEERALARRRRAAAGRQDGPGTGHGGARQGDGPGLHVLHRLRQRPAPGRPLRGHGGAAGVPAAVPRPRSTGGSGRPRPGAGGGRRVHRRRRAHRRHRRHPQRQGARGGEGPGVLPGDAGGQPGRAGGGGRPGRPRGGRARGRGAGQPGRHPAGRAHLAAARQIAAAFREDSGMTRPAAAGRRRPQVRPGDGRRARRGPGVRPRHHAPRGGQLPGPHAGARAAGGDAA